MDKKQVVTKLIGCVIFLLAGIQILLGVVWIIGNIMVIPGFAESRLFLQASRDFVLDEYVGILYPILLRVTSITGEGHSVVLYLIQIAVAFGAYTYFLQSFLGKYFASKTRKLSCFWAAYIVTFPMILQGHMSVLPYSLASSAVLLLVAEFRKLLTKEGPLSKRTVICIGVLWVIGALLLPDYSVILGIVVVLGFVMCGWKKERRWRVLLLTVFVAIGCIGGTLTLTQTPGSLGRIQKSAGSVMLSRFVWPYMERNSFFWSHEVKVEFNNTDFSQLSLYPERMIYEFGPRLEQSVGRERANELYWEMAADSFLIGKKDALVALGRDAIFNVGGPVGIQLQLSGKGISYTGWNYARMCEDMPAFTKYYVRFAGYSFDFMLLSAIVVWLFGRKVVERNTNRRMWILTFLLIGMIIIWYTMIGNGMQDYIKVMPINILWCAIPACGYALCRKSTEE